MDEALELLLAHLPHEQVELLGRLLHEALVELEVEVRVGLLDQVLVLVVLARVVHLSKVTSQVVLQEHVSPLALVEVLESEEHFLDEELAGPPVVEGLFGILELILERHEAFLLTRISVVDDLNAILVVERLDPVVLDLESIVGNALVLEHGIESILVQVEGIERLLVPRDRVIQSLLEVPRVASPGVEVVSSHIHFLFLADDQLDHLGEVSAEVEV